MNLLILYWKQIAVACALLGALLVGYYQGYSSEKAKFDAFKLELKVRTEALQQKNNAIVTGHKQITTNVAKEYANAVKKINAYYAAHPTIKWVRNTDTRDVSDVSDTTESIDGKTESDVPSTVNVSPLDCASDVLQLLHLQEWVRDQENVNR
jgi:hypothetical protein